MLKVFSLARVIFNLVVPLLLAKLVDPRLETRRAWFCECVLCFLLHCFGLFVALRVARLCRLETLGDFIGGEDHRDLPGEDHFV